MNIFAKIAEKIRAATEDHGYVCDHCGEEIFTYPVHRLCKNCEDKMPRIGEKFCEKCGRERISDGICLDCKARVPNFNQGIMPFVYRGEAAAMVNRMKIGQPTLALYFGEEMARTFAARYDGEKDEPLLIVPVPMTAAAKRQRGYNQAERLAKAVCKELTRLGFTAEVDTEILEKRRETAQQKHMSFLERMDNVVGAYHVHKRKACKDRRIILVDDIMTTGSTASECARRLTGAGASAVYFLAATALSERK
ncbi:MAG: ComF family protein [Clostridia bacterium]|nr:ComF family protein [Clostridia bacterium]